MWASRMVWSLERYLRLLACMYAKGFKSCCMNVSVIWRQGTITCVFILVTRRVNSAKVLSQWSVARHVSPLSHICFFALLSLRYTGKIAIYVNHTWETIYANHMWETFYVNSHVGNFSCATRVFHAWHVREISTNVNGMWFTRVTYVIPTYVGGLSYTCQVWNWSYMRYICISHMYNTHNHSSVLDTCVIHTRNIYRLLHEYLLRWFKYFTKVYIII